MGLGISAVVGRLALPEDDQDALVPVHDHEEFPGRLGGVAPGDYVLTEDAHFYRRPYGHYNLGRDEVAAMAGYPQLERLDGTLGFDCGAWHALGGPFWELIYFTDCDGFIGGTVVEKLLEDFKRWKDHAGVFESLSTDRAGFAKTYDAIMSAFAWAHSRNGLVQYS